MALQVLRDAEEHRVIYAARAIECSLEAIEAGATYREIAGVLGISVGGAHLKFSGKTGTDA